MEYDILDFLENKLIINESTNELWLYDKDGRTVIKKWPLRNKVDTSLKNHRLKKK